MKKSLLTLVAIVFSAFLETVSFAQNALYWEDYSPEKQNAIISSDSLDPLVSAYYYGEKQPSDDEDTFSFLEILASRTDQDDRRALFFHLESGWGISRINGLFPISDSHELPTVCF